MEFKPLIESYPAAVRELIIGKGEKSLKIGGQTKLPFNFFDEGEIPYPPRFAFEVYDMEPSGWAEAAVEPYQDVINDPVKWAQKCVDDYGADLICLQLLSTDPAEKDTSPDEAAELTKKVAEAINVPIIIYGSSSVDKDPLVLSKIAEVCAGMNLFLGPALKEDYEPITESALKYGHGVIAQTPLDINLLKELNVKVAKILPPEKIIIDPLSPGLGYGIEYSFSITERVKQIGIIHNDGMTQMPIIANLANECWKVKEVRQGSAKLGILWEAMTAFILTLAGADILVVRHPEAVKSVRELLIKGG